MQRPSQAGGPLIRFHGKHYFGYRDSPMRGNAEIGRRSQSHRIVSRAAHPDETRRCRMRPKDRPKEQVDRSSKSFRVLRILKRRSSLILETSGFPSPLISQKARNEWGPRISRQPCGMNGLSTSCRLFVHVPLNRVLHQFAGAAQRQLFLDMRLVGFHGLHAEVQFFGDLPGAVTFAD